MPQARARKRHIKMMVVSVEAHLRLSRTTLGILLLL